MHNMSNPILNPSSSSTDDDYSPSATLLHFPTPLPLLRHPFPVSPPDDPTHGPFILAFPTPHSFLTSLTLCHSHLLHHCHSATRFSCSLTASKNCQPPWWQTLFPAKKLDFKNRSQCEEREMEACLANSLGKCEGFAKEKVLGPFGWARVGLRERRVRKKEVGKLVSWVGFFRRDLGFKGLISEQFKELNLWYDVSYVRGCELLDDDNLPF